MTARGNEDGEDLPGASVAEPQLIENIETIAELHERAQQKVNRHQRTVEQLAGVIGRPKTILLVLICIAVWIAANLLVRASGHRPIDPPPFLWMQGVVALLALLTTMIILTTQNRQGKYAEQRAHLELQISLKAEQKVAKLIALVEELRRDLPSVPNRADSSAEAMTESVDPHAVVSALEELEEGKPRSRA